MTNAKFDNADALPERSVLDGSTPSNRFGQDQVGHDQLGNSQVDSGASPKDFRSLACHTAQGTAPWLLTGNLDADDEATLAEHLNTCEDCRAQLGDATIAALVFDQHPSADLLLAVADASAAEEDLIEVDAHCAVCAPCRELLEACQTGYGELGLGDSQDGESRYGDDSQPLPAASRTRRRPRTVRPTPRPTDAGRPGWWVAAAAAGLAGVFALAPRALDSDGLLPNSAMSDASDASVTFEQASEPFRVEAEQEESSPAGFGQPSYRISTLDFESTLQAIAPEADSSDRISTLSFELTRL